ncbi:Aldehyde/histidinol dehydrogenase [Cytidiella melzeri]|nr:Aldehyde/histidinol dehydrogenase [Cytidiella melzeri]
MRARTRRQPPPLYSVVNIDAAARCIISGAFIHSSQARIGTETVLVQRSISKELIEKMKPIAATIKAGDKTKNPSFVYSVLALLRTSSASEGAFVQPLLVLGAKPGSRLWDRESFGPVMTIAVVDTIDEAVDLANKTTYSLTSSLQTQNTDLASTLSPRIRAGKVIMNNTTTVSEPR